MKPILFASDLHLQAEEAHPLNQAFLAFLTTIAIKAQRLYLLGDTFETWNGDDIGLTHYRPIIQGIKQLTDRGVQVFMQYGNRDFLMREDFWQATGAQLLPDPFALQEAQQHYLLLHGDTLCTDDTEYQRFRKWVRNPVIQWLFLKLPIRKRKQIAESMRQQSEQNNRNKPQHIMDVNAQAIERLLVKYPQTQHIIHGHTHRPAQQQLKHANAHPCTRWVLGDWRKVDNQIQAEYLSLTPQPELKTFYYPLSVSENAAR